MPAARKTLFVSHFTLRLTSFENESYKGDAARTGACASVSAVRCAGLWSPERAFEPVHQYEPAAVCRRLTLVPPACALVCPEARHGGTEGTQDNRIWRQQKAPSGLISFCVAAAYPDLQRARRGRGRARCPRPCVHIQAPTHRYEPLLLSYMPLRHSAPHIALRSAPLSLARLDERRPQVQTTSPTDDSDVRWSALSEHHTSRASSSLSVMHKTVTLGSLQIPVSVRTLLYPDLSSSSRPSMTSTEAGLSHCTE